ncbi:hypothetical protein HPB48_005636 [Haemaphysalis longicornis]|uniref:Endonuclease/exonuclease/phosphatase domain-containing protein n=1 Tax=Haemaphysalis longicornis TaxID=44386 RepID=A0A9J6FYI4_HAELO|nr:hypothetical protein HPB48_005636 [Haemaphysalis longicornis]
MEFTGKHPDILVAQEAGASFPLHGNEVFSQPSITHRRRGIVDTSATLTMTLTYVRKDLPTTQNDTTHVNTPSHEHVSTTTLVGDHRLTVINVYWSPNQPSAPLPPLHTLIPTASSRDTVLLLGDFNCPHTTWGYDRVVPLGRKWANFVDCHQFTLLTEPSAPTRLGTGRESDTTPDLACIRGPLRAAWRILKKP